MPARYWDASMEGMATMKQAPPSARLNASIVPSCCSTTVFTMESPSPVPPVVRARRICTVEATEQQLRIDVAEAGAVVFHLNHGVAAQSA